MSPRNHPFLLICLMIFGPVLSLFPPPSHMSPKRVRQLLNSSSSNVRTPEMGVGRTQAPTRKRQLELDSSVDKPPRMSTQSKKCRTLDTEQYLANRLKEKRIASIKLPLSQMELKQLEMEIKLYKVKSKEENFGDSESETGSTSSELKVEKAASRKRGLSGKPKGLLKAMVDQVMEKSRDAQSLLESFAVTSRVREHYDKKYAELLKFIADQRLPFQEDTDVDNALVMFFNLKYLEGEGSQFGDYTIAALMDKQPAFGKQGQRHIPRAWRCLKGWRKLCPSRSRLAYPLAVWCGISWRMVERGHVQKAVFNLVQVSSYHRPGTLLKLRKLGLVKPTSGITGHWSLVTSLTETQDISKTGTKDDSIFLDSNWTQFMHPVLLELSRGKKEDMVWSFNYGEYLSVFRDCCRDLKIDVVPYQARHSGQISKHSQSRRSSKARRLGISPVSGKVREVREACSNLEQASHSYSKCDAKLRKAHCRDHPRPTLSHNLSVKAYSGGYFADFFAGKAGVARAVRSCGFSTREWELLKGADNDLTCPQVVHKVLSDINSDKVLGAMFAPPCASFSPARDRTMVVRDRDFPWGVPGLPPHEAFKVEIGNKCFKSSLKIIRALDRKGIPWVLENPHSSKCWRLAPLVKLLASSHVHCRVVDFCMYKTPWRKRTRLVFGNINMADTERFLHRFCSGRGGVCDNSHKKHFHLTGSARDGRPWTLVAQPYPSHLCHDIAYSLTTKYNVIPYNPGSI